MIIVMGWEERMRVARDYGWLNRTGRGIPYWLWRWLGKGARNRYEMSRCRTTSILCGPAPIWPASRIHYDRFSAYV